MKEFLYGSPMRLRDAMDIATGTVRGVLSSAIRERLEMSQARSLALSAGNEAVYGVNTGFGPLCSTRIPREQTVELQYTLLRSHSVGVGHPIPPLVSRLMLVT